MAELAVTRKQRLRTLENQIRQNYEAFVQTGFALKEIRDTTLYTEDGFETWDQYLKERVGKEFGIEQAQARKLIVCAQVRTKLPDISDTVVSEDGWSQKALVEFARLAPQSEEHEQRRDYDRLDKRDAARVAKKVIEHCKEEGEKPTAAVVRKFVDEELGVDRAAQAKETRRQREEEEAKAEQEREEEAHPLPETYFNDLIWHLKQDVDRVREIDAETWKQWKRDNPGLVKRLTAACQAFIDLF